MTLETGIKEAAEEAIEVVREFLRNPSAEREQMARVKYASSMVSNYVKHEQTQSAREATNFMMARELAQNSEQLAEYLKAASPSAPVLKALPSAKT